MQIAILVVLVLILLSLSPWIISLVAALAVAVGASYVALMIVVLALLPITLVAYIVQRRYVKRFDPAEQLRRKNKDFNDRYLASAEDVEPKKSHNSEDCDGVIGTDSAMAKTLAPPLKTKRLVVCPHCSSSIEKYSMYCPACGKDTKANPA